MSNLAAPARRSVSQSQQLPVMTGTEDLDWFALPQTDHPVIPQNLYRMSGGADNTERFEQIGQSWLKHAFLALEDRTPVALAVTPVVALRLILCSGCSDPYSASLNGDQTGSVRAHGSILSPALSHRTANNHNGHNRTTACRIGSGLKSMT